MAKTKQQKKEAVDKLQDRLSKSKIAVFSDYYGLKVSEMEELRNLLREQGIDYFVIKKTLLKMSLKDGEAGESDVNSLPGGVGIVFGYQDEILPPKILTKFAKGHAALKINGGILDGKFIGADYVSRLSALPSRLELLSKTVYMFKSPLTGLANVLQGNLKKLVYALDAIKTSKQ